MAGGRGGDGGNARTIVNYRNFTRSGVRRTQNTPGAVPQPAPIGGGSGTQAPIPAAAKPKPIGSILTGELSPLLGTGGPTGVLRRLFRPASQLRGGS